MKSEMAKSIITEKIKKAIFSKISLLTETEKKIAIVGHLVPDLDYLAAALALRHFFLSRFTVESDFFAFGGVSHPQNKTFVHRLQIELKDKEFFENNRDAYGLFVFCDTGRLNACIKNVEPDIVIDHHLDDENYKGLVIREKLGAVCSIVYLLLRDFETEISSEIATALALGISTDTKDLTKKEETTELDVWVHKQLLVQMDYSLFCHVSYRYEIPHQLLDLMGRGYKNAIFEDYLAIIGVGEITSGQKDFCAIIADMVFRVPETRLVVVIAIEKGEAIRASVRTDLETLNVDEFCRRVFEAGSATDTGESLAGARLGSGGAYVPLSTREREEWRVATEEQREILFEVKISRYHEKIRQILDS